MKCNASYAKVSRIKKILSAQLNVLHRKKAAERAANQAEYEQKQKDAAARAADLEQRRKDAPKRAQENKAGTQLD